ncbi:MAG: phosphoadenosine phosphosulfate reductase family protein [Kiritimatiellae bacterium]|nr:phosphoadenosine phosphosulfate reductase family protein [Kiritimatiellia bacterium]
MYSYKWNKKTGGYTLTTQTGKFVASEIRPVYAQELKLIGFDEYFKFDENETAPICWAKQNVYIYRGEEIAKVENVKYGCSIEPEYLVPPRTLVPVDVEAMVRDCTNQNLMAALVADTQKRIKEMYDKYMPKCDVAYIGFSGGKDSMLLLDICHRTLPLSVPVVFSDTDMELPDTYEIWEQVQMAYPKRTFIKAKADIPALQNWMTFGPPSQNLRWCCSVHKSTPAILKLKELSANPSAKMLAFVGVRGDESLRRFSYDDVGEGEKNSNQTNAMPIHSWSSHELFLYTFEHKLPINAAYRKGLPRVGCIMCPMSSARQSAIISQVYLCDVAKFEEAISQSISREFATKEDLKAFVGDGGWHARRSGVTLQNVMQFPGKRKIDGGYEFSVARLDTEALLEWLKALGRVTKDSDSEYFLMIREDIVVKVILGDVDNCNSVSFVFPEGKMPPKNIDKMLRFAVQKTIGCVGCRECQAECPTGALSFSPHVGINTDKCIHCWRCYDQQEGCIRFFSTRYAGGSAMNMNGINKYMTFGLRPDWITALLEEREAFRSTMRLGTRMVPSAVTWFREAGLIAETSAIELTRLTRVAECSGVENKILWECIWANVSNMSPLIKWYVSSVPANERKTQDELGLMIEAAGVSSASVRKGALSSLCSIIKTSPVSSDDYPIVSLEVKGKRVLSLTRVPHAVDDLALLYSLFVMARQAEQTSFSVSGLMVADFSAKYVSPIVAFAMSVADFKQQCQGLADRYGEFIHCNFTLGLDEIQIKTDQKSVDDVVDLMLNA